MILNEWVRFYESTVFMEFVEVYRYSASDIYILKYCKIYYFFNDVPQTSLFYWKSCGTHTINILQVEHYNIYYSIKYA